MREPCDNMTLPGYKPPVGGTPIPPGAIVFDSFTDADGTDLTVHTMDRGSGWNFGGSGTFIVQSDTAEWQSGSVPIVTDSGVADCTVEADIGAADGHAGLVVRWLDNDDFYFCTANDSNIFIYEYVGGNLFLRAIQGLPSDPGAYHMVVTLSGSTITCTVTGITATYGSASDNASSTMHGLGDNGGTSTLIDNFYVH